VPTRFSFGIRFSLGVMFSLLLRTCGLLLPDVISEIAILPDRDPVSRLRKVRRGCIYNIYINRERARARASERASERVRERDRERERERARAPLRKVRRGYIYIV
jgi:hypothetical protein